MGEIKFNRQLIISITLVSAMGGLLFGYDWVVIGGAKPFYERFFNITHSPSLQGWAMSSALVGCLFGALFSGLLSERTGTVNLIFTLVAMRMVDSWGRRKLMLLGSSGLAIIYLTLGFSYFSGLQGFPILLLVGMAIAVYALTLAPVTWVVLSEIFPNRIRGAAMALATTSLWIACFVLTYTFPLLNKALNASGTFWLYAFICLAGFIFILKKLPETKGKTLEEIENKLTFKKK